MQFRLGSIPVRVRFPFFLMVLLLGGAMRDETGRQDPRLLVLWAAIVFVSVLVHELGHAIVGRSFGLRPWIELHGMGGTTAWAQESELGHGRRIAVSLAGPFAGFLLGALVFAVSRYAVVPSSPLGRFAVDRLLWVNVGWGILNLVPMLPLDGGNVMRGVLQILTRGRGEKAARVVSIAIAGSVLLYAFTTQQIWIGFLGGLFVFSNVQALRTNDVRVADAVMARAIQEAYGALEAQDGERAIALLRPALAAADVSSELRAMGLRLFAYALMLEGNWSELLPMLEKERLLVGIEELERFAKTARELERTDEADRIDALVRSMQPRMANEFD